MKKILDQSGLSLSEMARLMQTPITTLKSWLDRKTKTPDLYQPYIEALKAYLADTDTRDLQVVEEEFDQTLTSKEIEVLQKRQQTLQVKLKTETLKLEELQIKKRALIQQYHLAKHLPVYMKQNFTQMDALSHWADVLRRKNAYELNHGTVKAKIREHEIRKRGLEAQLTAIEGLLQKTTHNESD